MKQEYLQKQKQIQTAMSRSPNKTVKKLDKTQSEEALLPSA